MCLLLSMISVKKIGIENVDLRDPVNGEVASLRGPPDRLGRRRVVETETPLAVGTDVRVNPRHIVFRIGYDDTPANLGALVIT